MRLLAAVVFVMALAVSAAAQSSEGLPSLSMKQGTLEFAGWTAGGHTAWGGTRSGSYELGGRFGYIITKEHGPGWLHGNLEYVVDVVPVFILPQPNKTAYGFGVNPVIFRWNFTKPRKISPHFEMGAGLLFTNTEIPTGASNHNYTPQGRIGVNIFLKEKRAVSLDLRFVHISNASSARFNPGFEILEGGIGFHWYK